jgi:hypothetical protein
MAHCPFDQLRDLADCFDDVRSWPGISEPAPGVFYLKRVAFMHFHVDKAGRRWADVRDGADWGHEIDVPLDPSPTVRRRFLREVRRRYTTTAGRPPIR